MKTTDPEEATYLLTQQIESHFRRMHPEDTEDARPGLTKHLMTRMSATAFGGDATSGDTMLERMMAAEERGDRGTEEDLLLTAWAYALEAMSACLSGDLAAAWPSLVCGQKFAGWLEGYTHARSSLYREAASLASRDHRRAAMQAMRDMGASDPAIAKQFHVSRTTVIDVLGTKQANRAAQTDAKHRD